VEPALVDQLAVAVRQHAHGRVLAVAVDREHVGVAAARLLDVLALAEPADDRHQVAVADRELEVLALGGRPHAGLEPRQQLAVAARQEQPHVLDRGRVVLGGGQAGDARAEAGLHVVVEAGPRQLAVDLDLAGADLEVGARKVHQPARHVLAHEGSEVAMAVVAHPPRELDPRPRLAGGELDVGVGLVVAQQDVEARPQPLDEGVLEDEGLDLGGGHGVVEAAGALEHRGVRSGRSLRPKMQSTAPQAARLADVDVLAGRS
jgi:hypothetical protein